MIGAVVSCPVHQLPLLQIRPQIHLVKNFITRWDCCLDKTVLAQSRCAHSASFDNQITIVVIVLMILRIHPVQNITQCMH